MVVGQILDDLGIDRQYIQLGEVQLIGELNDLQKQELRIKLRDVGFDLIDDRKSRMIEQIKQLVIEKLQSGEQLDLKWAQLIADHLHHDYKYLSSLFSSIEGITVEQYIIRQKIEKIKELMFYDELTLTQIAWQLGYSSVAHLSGQFKKITGMTASDFKSSFKHHRKNLGSAE